LSEASSRIQPILESVFSRVWFSKKVKVHATHRGVSESYAEKIVRQKSNRMFAFYNSIYYTIYELTLDVVPMDFPPAKSLESTQTQTQITLIAVIVRLSTSNSVLKKTKLSSNQ